MKSFSFLLYLVAAAAALVIHAFVVVGAPPSIPGTKRKFNNDNDIIHSPSSPSTSSSSSTSFSSSVIPSSSSLINLESLSIHDNDHSSTAQAPTSPLQVNDLLFEIWSWLPSDADRLNLRYISRHFAEASRQRSYRLNNWAAFRFAAKTGNLALLERIASGKAD